MAPLAREGARILVGSENDGNKRTKCVIEDNKLTPCALLDSALAPEANHGTGLILFVLSNFSTVPSTVSRSCVIAKSGEHKKRGLILKYCPWCGVNIGSHM